MGLNAIHKEADITLFSIHPIKLVTC